VQLGGVVQRQGSQGAIAGRNLQLDDVGQVLGDHAAMRHQRALRDTRGAGGVDDLRGRRIVQQNLGRHQRRVVRGSQHVQSDTAVERAERRRTGRLPRGGNQRRVVQQQGGAGLTQQIGKLTGGQRVIRGNVHQSGAAAAQPGQQVGGGVAAERCHPVARLQACCLQPGGDPAGCHGHIAARPASPAEVQRGAVAELGSHALDGVADRVPAGTLHVRQDVHATIPSHVED